MEVKTQQMKKFELIKKKAVYRVATLTSRVTTAALVYVTFEW